jgi:hypothetical protein
VSHIIKPVSKEHTFAMTDDFGKGMLNIVEGGPRRAYVWVGPKDGSGVVYTFSGERALRELAKAILKEIGE